MKNALVCASLCAVMAFAPLFQVQASDKALPNSDRYTYLGTNEHLKDGIIMSASLATALASAGYFVYSLTDKNLWYGSDLAPFAKTGSAGLLAFLAALISFKTSADCTRKTMCENVTIGPLGKNLDNAYTALTNKETGDLSDPYVLLRHNLLKSISNTVPQSKPAQ